MKMQSILSTAVFGTVLLYAMQRPALAQAPGYITGVAISSFDPASGQFLQSFPQNEDIGATAVSQDGTKLYSPQDNGTVGYLRVLSAADGTAASVIPGLSKGPKQARLSPSGNILYELSLHSASKKAWVAVVDLQAGKVVRYIHVSPGYPFDLAVSPDGSKLYLATRTTRQDVEAEAGLEERQAPGVPVSNCPLASGICVFDTATFALTGYVVGITGYLAVSQDGNSLYVVLPEDKFSIAVIHTASLKTSFLTLPQGAEAVRMAVAPSGNQAVVAGLALAGQSFPSGELIAQTAFGPSAYFNLLTF